MLLEFPLNLEQVLLSYIKQTFLPPKKRKTFDFNAKDIEFFSRGAGLLSQAFTEERGSLPPDYLNDPVCRSGYLLYFLPVNALKVVKVLQEFKPFELTSGKIRILDLGAGPGSGMLGTMIFYSALLKKGIFKEINLDFTLVDHSYSPLKDAINLHRAYADILSREIPGFHSACLIKHFDLRRESLNRFLRNFKYHLVLMENLLNEFPDNRQKSDFVESNLRQHVDPEKGKLIIIEPALKKTSRGLQKLRDEMIGVRKAGFVHAPCLHQERCPLNVVNLRDWCHFYFHWKRPDFIARVDRMIGNRKDWLACSYLVLGRKERDWKSVFSDHRNTWRVISNLMPSKGKKEVVLCGPPGRYHLTRLDRNASASNQSFDRLRRGDLIEHHIPGSQGYRVDGNSELTRNCSLKMEIPG